MKRFILLALFGLSLCLGADAQIITTYAGNGSPGYSGDSISATTSSLNSPYGISYYNKNLIIADYANQRIRKIDSLGIITTLMGNGLVGYIDGPASVSQVSNPKGVFVDATGLIHIADTYNNAIRNVNFSGISGTDVSGNLFINGSVVCYPMRYFNHPTNVIADNSGNIFIADASNNNIKELYTGTTQQTYMMSGGTCGVVTTAVTGTNVYIFAGNSSGFLDSDAISAKFNNPVGLAIDFIGNIYVADANNNRIRKINTTGTVTTIAGNGIAGYSGDGGLAINAKLNSPQSIVIDGQGNLFIADAANNVIRKVTTSGIISTYAGNGSIGFLDNCPATSAELYYPVGLAIDKAGNLFISDQGNNRIRKISGIEGISAICIGDTTTIKAGLLGGSWSSSSTSIATISSSGLVTAISSGLVTITYTRSTDIATLNLIVGNMPYVDSIVGTNMLCVGSSITLTDSILGGIWSVNNGNLSVSGGIVTGITSGTSIVSYSVSNFCGTSTSVKNITINPIPSSGLIIGDDTLCLSNSITLTNSVNGVWSVANNHATIDSFGIITGLSIGLDTVIYTVNNICINKAYKEIYVENCLLNIDNIILGKQIIYPNPNNGNFIINSEEPIIITDILGKHISYTQTKNNICINSGSGIYYIKIGNKIYTINIL